MTSYERPERDTPREAPHQASDLLRQEAWDSQVSNPLPDLTKDWGTLKPSQEVVMKTWEELTNELLLNHLSNPGSEASSLAEYKDILRAIGNVISRTDTDTNHWAKLLEAAKGNSNLDLTIGPLRVEIDPKNHHLAISDANKPPEQPQRFMSFDFMGNDKGGGSSLAVQVNSEGLFNTKNGHHRIDIPAEKALSKFADDLVAAGKLIHRHF